MRRALNHPVRAAVSTAFVLRAAMRVLWHEPRADLAELVGRLRSAPPARVRFDASLADGVLERLLPLLPPWGAGRCVKRSLMQLDLWSRAGRAPRLHLGVLASGPARHGHVWVTADGPVTEGVADGPDTEGVADGPVTEGVADGQVPGGVADGHITERIDGHIPEGVAETWSL